MEEYGGLDLLSCINSSTWSKLSIFDARYIFEIEYGYILWRQNGWVLSFQQPSQHGRRVLLTSCRVMSETVDHHFPVWVNTIKCLPLHRRFKHLVLIRTTESVRWWAYIVILWGVSSTVHPSRNKRCRYHSVFTNTIGCRIVVKVFISNGLHSSHSQRHVFVNSELVTWGNWLLHHMGLSRLNLREDLFVHTSNAFKLWYDWGFGLAAIRTHRFFAYIDVLADNCNSKVCWCILVIAS